MSWFDKLKNLFDIDIEIKDLVNIHINKNDYSKKYEYHGETKVLSINLEKLSPSEKEDFKPILKELVEDDKILLEEKSEKLIEDFKSKEKSGDTQSLLKYFEDKIPADDHNVLRAALYLRKHFHEDRTGVYEFKTDIMRKYGKRGGNICNLCTAGYFETMLKPLYQEMAKDPDFSEEKFLRIYEIIIQESAFAVFVHFGMSSDEVKMGIEEKIKTNLNYGQNFVNIHGIGSDNVEKIRNAITEIESKNPGIRKTIEEKQNIIFVKLQF